MTHTVGCVALAAVLTAAAGVGPRGGTPHTAAAPRGERPQPAAGPARRSETPPASADAPSLFVACIKDVRAGPTGLSNPPVYTSHLVLQVTEVLGGDLRAGQTLEACHTVRQQEPPGWPVEPCIFTGKRVRGRFRVVTCAEADAKALAEARAEASLPLGWRREGGKPISPWVDLGKAAWPEGAGVPEGAPVCSTTGRPALLAGDGVRLTVTPVPAEKKIKWTNPDGDGLFRVTVANATLSRHHDPIRKRRSARAKAGAEAGAEAAETAAPRFEVSALKREDDRLTVTQDDGRTVFNVVCPFGIGAATVTAAEAWPAHLTVRLRYAKDRPFERLEGFACHLVKGQADGEEAKPLKHRIAREDGALAVVIDVPPEVRTWPTLRLRWIDVYRRGADVRRRGLTPTGSQRGFHPPARRPSAYASVWTRPPCPGVVVRTA